MEYKSTNAGYGYVVCLEKGERVVEGLSKLAEQEGLTGGFFYGIGAVKNIILGRFDVSANKYVFEELPDVFELASLNGNVSRADGKPFIHAHVVLADGSLRTHAGHLKEAGVAVTCEIFIHLQRGADMVRTPDDQLNLRLLHFE